MSKTKTLLKGLLTKEKMREIIEITIGVLIMTIGFYFFFLPASLVTGGVLGLSIVFQEYVGNEQVVTLFVTVVNFLLLVIGGLILGKNFFLRTIYGSILLSVYLFLFEKVFQIDSALIISQISEGKLLISAIFGAIFTGFGLGLVLRNNATTGGMDIVQRILTKYVKMPFSLAMYLIDGVVIILGVIATKSLEGGFYAVGALMLLGVVVDYVIVSGRSGYTLFIVTEKAQEVKEAIYRGIDRGITQTKVTGGFSEVEKDMLICTITKRQLYTLKHIIQVSDPDAFTFITKTNEALGQGFRQENS